MLPLPPPMMTIQMGRDEVPDVNGDDIASPSQSPSSVIEMIEMIEMMEMTEMMEMMEMIVKLRLSVLISILK
jgi:hypothetical protein